MEPRIQYAKTSDGVNIAYWTLGEGPALVQMPPVWSHAQLEWQFPEMRRWYEGLATGRRLIRFDPRGFGLSDRTVTEYSVDSQMLDLAAVLDRLELAQVDLFGLVHSGPAAIEYAALHPERVSHLLLWCSYAYGKDYYDAPQLQSLLRLRGDWELFTETLVHARTGWSEGEPARLYARLIRESTTPEAGYSLFEAIQHFDVRDALASVNCPTLVLHPRELHEPDLSLSTDLAARIEGAQLAVIEGSSMAWFLDAGDAILSAVDAFLSPNAAAMLGASGMTAILFTDIADSTALTERMGDAAFRAKARELGSSLRTVIRECGGTPVEGPTLGDGVLAVFTSAREAIEAARRCGKAGDEAGLPLHLGLHAGDVSREKDPDGRDNVYGGAVNIAARISGLSAPGEVLVSDVVRTLARTSAGVRFEDRGEQALKGVGEPVRVWAVEEQP